MRRTAASRARNGGASRSLIARATETECRAGKGRNRPGKKGLRAIRSSNAKIHVFHSGKVFKMSKCQSANVSRIILTKSTIGVLK